MIICFLSTVSSVFAQADFHYRTRLLEPFVEMPFYNVSENTSFYTSFVLDELEKDSLIENIVRDDTAQNRRYRVDIDDNNSVHMKFFIFSSIEDAEIHVLEYLSTSNVYPKHESQISANHNIGNNVWYGWNEKIVIFIRNNVEVRIVDNYSESDNNSVRIAKLVDSFLLQKKTVSGSELVPVPKINSVTTVSSKVIGNSMQYKLNVEADDPLGQNLYYNIFGWSSENPFGNGVVTVSSGEQLDKTRIWILNEDHFVSTVEHF